VDGGPSIGCLVLQDLVSMSRERQLLPRQRKSSQALRPCASMRLHRLPQIKIHFGKASS